MKIEDFNVEHIQSIPDLINQYYKSGGFTAKKIGLASAILTEMFESESKVFLTFPACIIATGTRGIIKELLKKKLVDGVITTCGSLDHDIARTFKPYIHGTFDADDKELYRKGINRLGNVFIPTDSYGTLIETKITEFFRGSDTKMSTYEIAWAIGKNLDENSFLWWAWKNKIPVFIPAITDGAVGTQLWLKSQQSDFNIDIFIDEQKLSEMFFTNENIDGIILGGGVSKHHLIWWAQFTGGLNSAVYITSAVEWDGSLSGARLREAISWGKLKEESKYITIEGDITVLFPLLVTSLLHSIK